MPPMIEKKISQPTAGTEVPPAPPAGQTIADLQRLTSELEDVMRTFTDYHTDMEKFRNFYKYSAFFPRRQGDPPTTNRRPRNFLKTFARKNILYTSPFPLLKVPTPGASPEDRQAAAMREKILYAIWRKSGGPLLQKKWANDATVESIAIAETGFDLQMRCAYVRRYNPRHCYWQISNDNEPRVIAFWAVFAITADEAYKRYGVRPTADLLLANGSQNLEARLRHIDGKKWFTMAIRWDENTRTKWIGNVMAEPSHNHLMGHIPIDVCMPFDDDDQNGQRGSFYLTDLVPLQAELNDVVMRRSAVNRRMSDPAVWARGATTKGLDEFKQALESGNGGGFLGLSKDGEAGILQLQETNMLDNAKNDLLADMQRIAGFSAATFGESVGANTSGDALGMYFTPTQKHIDDQNISWVAFYQSINAKILKLYDTFGYPEEQFSLDGYMPHATLQPITDKEGNPTDRLGYFRGNYSINFTKDVIAGKYTSVVIPRAVTPKNELEEKRLVKESVDSGFLSRTTGYEMWEVESPEEELALLTQEKLEPALNPDGVATILQGGQKNFSTAQAPKPNPAPAPAAVGG